VTDRPTEPNYPKLVASPHLVGDAAAMRARMAADGYLFLPALLPPDEVGAIRAEALAICAAAGWLKPGGSATGAVESSAACQPPDPRYYEVFNKIISLESFNRLAHCAQLEAVTSALFNDPGDVIARPGRLLRLIFPQPDIGATPPHQDFPHEQGTVDAFTSWIPFGDVPLEQGGLAVWPGSHRLGVLDHGFVPGVGGLGIRTDTMAPAWHASPFAVGDVILFHSLTVHKALPNRTADRLRMSGDFRFQRASEPMAPHMLKPSGGQLDWPDVYAGWTSDSLQHYWRRWNLTVTEYDRRYYHKRDEEAMTLARSGDQHALSFLHTISLRNPDPAMRQAATDLMTELSPSVNQDS
jgi:Phytanoyl-CoA dioxygenase (PhyH)